MLLQSAVGRQCSEQRVHTLVPVAGRGSHRGPKSKHSCLVHWHGYITAPPNSLFPRPRKVRWQLQWFGVREISVEEELEGGSVQPFMQLFVVSSTEEDGGVAS